ncbi:DUF2939 domain-containing protein [Janthinobacterium aquaticum]|uniref:DUF2939 domain-containing protein n=1 Tax=Janthinobacterium sp. FT58W TaxID=2654254 RepID=UPI00186AEC27|nr:DUF2939 domain-containing protein [Janthinobacterium sp. FT58W]
MKKLGVAATAAAVVVIATVYASPYLAVRQIKTALAERDAVALADKVDFPALRESVKQQMNGAMADSVKAVGASDNPFAAMGQAVAGAMLGKMVDAMVTPGGVLAMVNQSALGRSAKSDGVQADSAPARERTDYTAGYAAWDKFVIRAKQDGDNHNGKSGALVLRRHGLWTWKLSAIEVSRG